MPSVSPSESHKAFREATHKLVDERARHERHGHVRSQEIKHAMAEVFTEAELNDCPDLSDRDFTTELAARADAAGFDHHDLQAAMQMARRHMAVEHEFISNHRDRAFIKDTKDRTKFPNFFRQRLLRYYGAGMASSVAYDTSLPSGGSLDLSKDALGSSAQEIVRTAVEQQNLRKRYDQYAELGGPRFKETLETYANGKLTYQGLLDHPSYIKGIERITGKLRIDDWFVLDADAGIEIDAREADVKTAIRKHIGFVLRSEVAQLVELRQLGVVSTPDVPEYATRESGGVRTRLLRMLRAVSNSGTAWAFTGTMIGGHLAGVALDHPGALVTAGLAVIGAAKFGAIGRYINAKWEAGLRQKQRRLELSMGTVPTYRDREGNEQALVPEAQALYHELLSETQSFARDAEAGAPEHTLTAAKKLYAIVADVRARLRRSREGNQPDHHHIGPAAIDRPKGKPSVHSGAAAIDRPKDDAEAQARAHAHSEHGDHHDADEPERFDKNAPKQDYINFGLANRFQAQQQLGEALEYALSVLAKHQPTGTERHEVKAKEAWAKMQKDADAHAEHHIDEVQHMLDHVVEKAEKTYVRAATWRGFQAGLASGLAAQWVNVAGILAGIVTEFRSAMPTQRTAYAGHDRTELMDQPGYAVHDVGGREPADVVLPDVYATADVVRTERLAKTKPERERQARATIRQAITVVERRYAPTLDAMEKLLRTMRERGAGTDIAADITALQPHAAALAEVGALKDQLVRLLASSDEDISYATVDFDEGGKLAKTVREVDAITNLGDSLKRDVQQQLHLKSEEIKTIHQLPDLKLGKSARKEQLKLILASMQATIAAADQLRPSFISDWDYQGLEDTVESARRTVEGAIDMMDINTYIGFNDELGEVMKRILKDDGIIDPSDPTLPAPAKLYAAARIANKLRAVDESLAGLTTLRLISGDDELGYEVDVKNVERFMRT